MSNQVLSGEGLCVNETTPFNPASLTVDTSTHLDFHYDAGVSCGVRCLKALDNWRSVLPPRCAEVLNLKYGELSYTHILVPASYGTDSRSFNSFSNFIFYFYFFASTIMAKVSYRRNERRWGTAGKFEWVRDEEQREASPKDNRDWLTSPHSSLFTPPLGVASSTLLFFS